MDEMDRRSNEWLCTLGYVGTKEMDNKKWFNVRLEWLNWDRNPSDGRWSEGWCWKSDEWFSLGEKLCLRKEQTLWVREQQGTGNIQTPKMICGHMGGNPTSKRHIIFICKYLYTVCAYSIHIYVWRYFISVPVGMRCEKEISPLVRKSWKQFPISTHESSLTVLGKDAPIYFLENLFQLKPDITFFKVKLFLLSDIK